MNRTILKKQIKDWFLTKMEHIDYMDNDGTIVKETEKAICARFDSDYGFKEYWIPKSCVMTIEEAFGVMDENISSKKFKNQYETKKPETVEAKEVEAKEELKDEQ